MMASHSSRFAFTIVMRGEPLLNFPVNESILVNEAAFSSIESTGGGANYTQD